MIASAMGLKVSQESDVQTVYGSAMNEKEPMGRKEEKEDEGRKNPRVAESWDEKNLPPSQRGQPKKRDALGVFPDPLVVPPQLDHRQTIIVLHGRGSFAAKFAPPLLETATPDGETLQAAFPHAKFVFPTACKEKATIYKNPTHQWFDNWHLEEHNMRQHLMVEGLNKSCGYVHGLLREAVGEVGAENVVLWGLSQGCSTSLVSLLTWDGEGIAGVVGMCGWLAFGDEMVRIAGGGKDELDDEDVNPFALSGDEDEVGDPFDRSENEDEREEAKGGAEKAVEFLRESIDMEDKKGMVFGKIPVFLGHGTEDESVRIELGREAKKCLELLGVDVQMKEYEGLGHWYSEEMLRDIFRFIKEKLNIE